MTSIPTIIYAFLLGALAFAALGSFMCVTARVAREALARRAQMRRELAGDWGSRFEREFQSFADNQGRPHR